MREHPKQGRCEACQHWLPRNSESSICKTCDEHTSFGLAVWAWKTKHDAKVAVCDWLRSQLEASDNRCSAAYQERNEALTQLAAVTKERDEALHRGTVYMWSMVGVFFAFAILAASTFSR